MRAEVIYQGSHGVAAPHMNISRRWPLVGMIGSLAWRFDGRRVVIRLVRSDRLINRPTVDRRGMVRG